MAPPNTPSEPGAGIRPALEAVDRPTQDSSREDKKNYAERLSRELGRLLANGLRPRFPGILPDADGKGVETKIAVAAGEKKLDVSFATAQLGLGFTVSIKTISFPDPKTGRFTKNFTRNDKELREEAEELHRRFPYAVVIGVLFMPWSSCDDGRPSPDTPSSFGQAIQVFRYRAGRSGPKDEAELFERFFVALYEPNGPQKGDVAFFDVMNAPPKRGRPDPQDLLTLAQFLKEVEEAFRTRNEPVIRWKDDPPAAP